MTRIEKDLPDPLEAPESSPVNDPDELVAQLAGDAIDRLLEETEKGLVPSRPKPQEDPLDELESPVRSSSGSVQSPVPSDPVDSPMIQADPSIPGSDKVVSESSGEVQDSPDRHVSESSEKEVSLDTVQVSGSETVVSESVRSIPDASFPMPPPVDVPPEIANDDGHAESLESTDLSNPMTDVRNLLLMDEAQDSSRSWVVSAVLFPLKLINAPFSGLSDQTRDVLGQIGLITLVNALAILAYVLIFR